MTRVGFVLAQLWSSEERQPLSMHWPLNFFQVWKPSARRTIIIILQSKPSQGTVLVHCGVKAQGPLPLPPG